MFYGSITQSSEEYEICRVVTDQEIVHRGKFFFVVMKSQGALFCVRIN